MMETLQSLLAQSANKHHQEVCIVFDDGVDDDDGFKSKTKSSSSRSRSKPTSSTDQQNPSHYQMEVSDDGRELENEERQTLRTNGNRACLLYSEFWSLVEQFADSLSHLHLKDQVIAVMLKNDINVPVILSGILLSCNSFYPVNLDGPRYTLDALKKAGVTCIVTHRNFLADLTEVLHQSSWTWESTEIDLGTAGDLRLIRVTAVPGSEAAKSWPGLAYCISTSGTTSSPKVVRVPHTCILPNIVHLGEIFELGPRDRVLLTAPLTFDPSIIDIFCSLTRGACLVIVPREVKQRPDLLLDVLHHRQRVTCMQATPSLMRRFSAQKLQSTILGKETSLRLLALGGEHFPSGAELRDWLHPENKTTKFFNLYGITEVSCWATYHQLDVEEYLSGRHQCPIGQPLKQTLIKVESGAETSAEEETVDGEIFIGSCERVCTIDEKFTASRRPPGKIVWRKTGDCGQLLPDGSVVCVGRSDDQIKRQGKRINLDVLAQVCKELPWILDCISVFSKEILTVFIVLDSTSKMKQSLDSVVIPLKREGPCEDQSFDSWDACEETLRQHLTRSLPSSYRPDQFVWMTVPLPVTSHGKVDKRSLVSLSQRRVSVETRSLAEDPVRWAQTLWTAHLPRKISEIKPDDTFLHLGGDSLAVTHLVSTLDLLLFDSPTDWFELLLNKTFAVFVERLESVAHRSVAVCGQIHSSTPTTRFVVESGDKNFTDKNTSDNFSSSSSLERKRIRLDMVEHLNETRQIQDAGVKSFPCQNSSNKLQVKNLVTPGAVKVFDQRKAIQTISRGNRCVMISDLPQAPINSTACSSSFEISTPELFDIQASSSQAVSYKRHDAASLGEEADQDNAADGQPVVELGFKWKFDTKKCVDASPLLMIFNHGAVAFIGSHSGQFSAIDVETGQALWSVSLPDRIESSACCSLDGKFVSVGCYDGVIYTLDALSGSTVWTYQTEDTVKCSPVVSVSTGWLLCGSHDGHLYCLDVQHQRCMWRHRVDDGSIFSSPAVDDDLRVVYVASLRGNLQALHLVDFNLQFALKNIDSGQVKWKLNLKKPVFSSLTVVDRSVLVACVDGNLYCVQASGLLAWTFSTSAPIFSTPVAHKSYIFLASHDQHVYCLGLDGRPVWKHRMPATVYSSVFLCDFSSPRHQSSTLKCSKPPQNSTVGRLLDHESDSSIRQVSDNRADSPLMSESQVFVETAPRQMSLLSRDASLLEGAQETAKITANVEVSNNSDVSSGAGLVGSSDVTRHNETKCDCCQSQGCSVEDIALKRSLRQTLSSAGTGSNAEASLTLSTQNTPNEHRSSLAPDQSRTICCSCNESDQREPCSQSQKCECGVESQHIGKSDDSSHSHFLRNAAMSSCHVCPSSNSQTEVLIAASTDGTVHMIDPNSGALCGTLTLPGQVFSSAVAFDGKLVIGCRDNFVYCYDCDSRLNL